MKRTVRTLALAFSASLLAACADQVVVPPQVQGEDAAQETVLGGVPRDVPAVSIQLPEAPRPWDRSPAELERTLAARVSRAHVVGAGEGAGRVHAVVAFKERRSARALRTGVRAAVSARAVSAGLELLRRQGVEVVELLEHIGAARVRLTPRAAAALADDPRVDYVEPRQYASLHAQTTPWGISAVRAPQAWLTTTGVGVPVLIVDGGYQAGHPDLRSLPIAHCAGAYGGCDDAAPWHGTHVMGIISARDNKEGVVGVGPGINGQMLYSYGACGDDCPTDEVAAGIDWGMGLGVKVINLSLGSPYYDVAMANAVAQAWGSGIVVVASAGNRAAGSAPMMTYPAALPNVVAVSGVGQNLAFAEGICGGAASSNYGGHVDIAAPFEAYSTIGVGAYGIMCGTSMAAPHVTGAVALIQAKNPAWSADRVVKQLLASARPAGAAGWDPYYGYGILDVEKAVGPELADPRPAGPTVTMTGPAFTYTGQTYTWSASASGGTGSYSYLWHRRMAGSNVWVVATTDPSLSLTMFNDQDFELRVTVASGGKTVEATRSVTVQSLCDGCQEP